MIRTTTRALAVSIFALACASPALSAVEAQKVADAIAAQLANYNIEFQTTSAELQGSNVSLKGVSLSSNGQPLNGTIDLLLENVTEKGDGFQIGQIASPANKFPVKEGTWEFGGASIKNVSLAGPSSSDLMKAFLVYEKMELQPSRFVSSNGEEFMRIGNGTATMSPLVEGQPLNFDVVVDGIFIDTKLIAKGDQQGMAAANALGVSQINAKLTGKGSWNPTDGKMVIEDETIDIANVGKLGLALDLSGYTLDFIKSLQQMSKTAAGGDKAATGMAMMGLAQQLTFHSFKIRYDDASFTAKALDYAANQSGQPKEALAMQIKGMAPMLLMQLQDVDFATAASAAVSAFIDNPKSIEIKAAPATPLPFAVLISTGMATPAALIKQLGVTVTANQ